MTLVRQDQLGGCWEADKNDGVAMARGHFRARMRQNLQLHTPRCRGTDDERRLIDPDMIVALTLAREFARSKRGGKGRQDQRDQPDRDPL